MNYELTKTEKKARMNRAEKRVTHYNRRPFTIHSQGKARVIKANDLDSFLELFGSAVVGLVIFVGLYIAFALL